jgi:hypothetical protein
MNRRGERACVGVDLHDVAAQAHHRSVERLVLRESRQIAVGELEPRLHELVPKRLRRLG